MNRNDVYIEALRTVYDSPHALPTATALVEEHAPSKLQAESLNSDDEQKPLLTCAV